ncbi:DUF2293 domain-containing protein [Antarcticimicrobium luteum]|uniref:DUF2293 domain-containing protein n=1 Tax=Antarcticimicrobium luteum TaxID=2547397 RepID=A0A4R5VF93_9RHOB|nr:DUF2293 domain-containing protein [Antarcticimicrobium luteum]TDK50424.1 DUF2293 domain-containing protein [Antarcticimicrobium luteum]
MDKPRIKLKVWGKDRNFNHLKCCALSRTREGDPRYYKEAEEQHGERAMVNYIRHEYTNYDDLIERGYDRDEVRPLVLRRIGEAYPSLLRECTRQGADMTGYKFDLVPNEQGILQRVWRHDQVARPV